MSRRTSEASKAIRSAWLRERELVSEGRGTRDWIPEQQKEILELGKAYYHSNDPNDINDGKAFEGHHMKSAEAYPEYQGDPENIQFLSRPEHQEAHGGDYRNPTNGYFDPVTKVTQNFGENKYKPCEIIELSNPIVITRIATYEPIVTKENSPKQKSAEKLNTEQQKKSSTPISTTIESSPRGGRNFGEKIIDAIKAIKDFCDRHPVIVGTIVAVATGQFHHNSGILSSDGTSSSLSDDYCSSSSDDDSMDSDVSDDYDDSSADRNYPDERSSPEEHTVPAHGQHYHTKNGVIWKEKESYQRGGKHDDD